MTAVRIALTLLLLGSPLAAQVTPEPAGTVAGVVRDVASKAPVAGASVEIAGRRTTTDAAGRFSLASPLGQVEVRVQAPGSLPHEVIVQVLTGATTSVELEIPTQPAFAETVDVVGATPAAAPATQELAPVQVLRTPGALDNVFRTLQTLPGVNATEEFGSRLAVRGGSPDQNLTMMDGVEVHDPYRLFGLTSAFNPEIIQRFELSTGGFSAKYGDRLSSLLVVENRDGSRAERFAGSAALSITDANVVFEGALPGGAAGSWLVTGRRTYYDLVAERITDNQFPGFADVQAKAVWEPASGRKLTLFGLRSRQSAALEIDEDDARGAFQDDTENDLAWARFDATVGARGQSHTVIGYSDTRSAFGVDAAFETTSRRSNAPEEDSYGVADVVFERALSVKDVAVRQELAWALGAHVVETGGELHRLTTRFDLTIDGDRNPQAVNGFECPGRRRPARPAPLVAFIDPLRSVARRHLAAASAPVAAGRVAVRPQRPWSRGPAVASPVAHRRARCPHPAACRRGPLHPEPRLREDGAERLRARPDQHRCRPVAERAGGAGVGRRRAGARWRGRAAPRRLRQALHRGADRTARVPGRLSGPDRPLRLPRRAGLEHPDRTAHHHRADQRRPWACLRLRRVHVASTGARRRPPSWLGQLHLGPGRTRGLRAALPVRVPTGGTRSRRSRRSV